jgi:hypothetical protein
MQPPLPLLTHGDAITQILSEKHLMTSFKPTSHATHQPTPGSRWHD